MSQNENQPNQDQQESNSPAVPFFARYLEGQLEDLPQQETESISGGSCGDLTAGIGKDSIGVTEKYPSDNEDVAMTLKYPSDNEDVAMTRKYPSDHEDVAMTEKYPSDHEDVAMTLKYPSDNEEGHSVTTLKYPSDNEDA